MVAGVTADVRLTLHPKLLIRLGGSWWHASRVTNAEQRLMCSIANQLSGTDKGRTNMGKISKGFTLIEIAIVLVIIGLLLGGVLKGQELITGARVRNLISQQDGIKAAFFGFQDRYRALPGDYAAAGTNISGVSINGDGNGQIELANTAGTAESILVWNHL